MTAPAIDATRQQTGPSANGVSSSRVRVTAWIVPVSIPVAGLWLLIARPELDVHYEHHEVHFWLVLATAAVSLVLAIVLLRAARSRGDARLFLVSVSFQLNAGFLGAHALATPGVLVTDSNAGFVAATPVGLVLGGIAALASSIRFSPSGAASLMRRQWAVAALPWTLLAAWAVGSLLRLPPLDGPAAPVEAQYGVVVAAFAGAPLYLVAAYRLLSVYRRRPAVVLLSVLTAFVLLAEALFAVGLGRSWRASWWEWHLLMVCAFGLIAVSAHVQFRREGSTLGLFDSVTLRQTVAALERDYAAALEEMVDALRRRADGGAAPDEPLGAVGLRLARRFGLSERQLAVLQQGATALGHEREQVRRLRTLAAVGMRASVIRDEQELLTEIVELAASAFDRDELRLGLVRSAALTYADGRAAHVATAEALATLRPTTSSDGGTLVLPLTVKRNPAGVLEVGRRGGGFTAAEHALLTSLASQISVALENARLYQQLDGLFRSYMSPAVATALIADPEQASLGGRVDEVTVLMADLRGFTPFSERSSPEAVVAMLNTYFGAVVPVILGHGGTVVQFAGDAVMAVFNAPARQPDHVLRATRAAVGLHRAVDALAERHDRWPRFGVGINTGPALVGNIGAAQMRNFTAIGDTTNLAARLQGLAGPGQVVIGATTRELLGTHVRTSSRQTVRVSGKRDPVSCYVLDDLVEGPMTADVLPPAEAAL